MLLPSFAHSNPNKCEGRFLNMINNQQKKQLQGLLEQEQLELQKRFEEHGHYGLENSMNESVGELSGYDNHPADLGSELFERSKDLGLHDMDEHHLHDIQDALSRLKSGDYGQCTVCHQEIPFERLEAVPWTKYCIEHQPEQHSSIRRPVEEQVLHSPEHTFLDKPDYNAFDGEDAWQAVEQYGTSNPPDFFRDGEDYNSLYIDQDEPRGYVDLVEAVAITDITGHVTGFAEITHNDAYRQLEQEESGYDDEWM
ncbi:transcriptional regulator, TraR/DksA family [Thermoactinomyces sp. DSM 45891]|nr:transcriptional regulator, TraR/DksA family [Thermoactinomyces sp. DSM 45891]